MTGSARGNWVWSRVAGTYSGVLFLYLCLRCHRCSYESTLSFTSAFAQEYFSLTPKLQCWNIEKTLWKLLFLCFGAFIFHHSSCQTQNLGSRKVREQPSTKGSCFNAALQTLWQARKKGDYPSDSNTSFCSAPSSSGRRSTELTLKPCWCEQLKSPAHFPGRHNLKFYYELQCGIKGCHQKETKWVINARKFISTDAVAHSAAVIIPIRYISWTSASFCSSHLWPFHGQQLASSLINILPRSVRLQRVPAKQEADGCWACSRFPLSLPWSWCGGRWGCQPEPSSQRWQL